MASNAPHPRGTPGPPTTSASAAVPAAAMPDTGTPPQMTSTTSPAGQNAPPSSTPMPTSAHLTPPGTSTGSGAPIPPPPPPAAPPVATPAGESTPPSSGPSAATQAAAVAMVAHGQGMQGMAAEDWAAGFVAGHGLPLADSNGAENRPTLNVRDALAYLEEVKRQFADRIEVYNLFLDIMKDFKSSRLSTPDVITRVSSLFDGHPALITGFNTFLPAGYRIELTGDPSQPMRVITPEGTTTTRALLGFDAQAGRPASGPAALASLASLAPSPSNNASTLLPRPASATSGLGGTVPPNAPQGGLPGSHLSTGTPPAANLDPMAQYHGYGQPLQMAQQAGGAPSVGPAPAAGTPPAAPGTVPATLIAGLSMQKVGGLDWATV
ncbi:hypothetical protein AMAG_18006 [Allomyces macrogynus ATCC 38327]|uniref:Histone deacetylase interacting domain-containing protein n=1 Tax=Allomyces macrogynus (strain ATCC 38327) TaxID=578462 RepID=A0A0L0S3K7_ALLM3|nr:hypothetical protein AMAG_18006 [Allomyces macrogynus ATCC 38327]|eukprot:KNE57143.1 hypothetical protein AMAG_18006 [Allomyces macrogynus ATCC 38327]